MTRFLDKSFSSRPSTKEYRDRYDAVFGKRRNGKSRARELAGITFAGGNSSGPYRGSRLTYMEIDGVPVKRRHECPSCDLETVSPPSGRLIKATPVRTAKPKRGKR